MAKVKKKPAQAKKKPKKLSKVTKSKVTKSKVTVDLKTDMTGISDGAMKDAFREAFLRREI